MIRAHHPLQREQPAAGAAGHRGGGGLRRLHAPAHPAGRHPRPLRHAGDRLLALGPQPRHPRGPGHLPDRHRAAGRAQGEGDPRLLRLRLQLRLRHLRGRHRPLLGAHPRARVPEQDPAAAARRACRPSWGRTPPAWAGCTSTRWWTTRAQHSSPSCAPSRTGTCATRCSPCPAWPRWPPSAASCSSTRSRSIPRGSGAYGLAIWTWSARRCARSNDDVGGRLVEISGREYMVRGRGYVKSTERPRADRAQDATSAARRSLLRDVAHVALGPEMRRGVDRPRRPGRRGGRHRGDAPRRERAERHRAREAAAGGAEASLPDGRATWSPPTTARDLIAALDRQRCSTS